MDEQTNERMNDRVKEINLFSLEIKQESRDFVRYRNTKENKNMLK